MGQSTLAQNKDDKLTQSQVLKRMLEADERDNARERQREQDKTSSDRRREENRLNDARLAMMSGSASADRGRGNDVKGNGDMEESYVSSSMASSFDYRALTDEEKARILGQSCVL